MTLIRRIKPLFADERHAFWYSPSTARGRARALVQRRRCSKTSSSFSIMTCRSTKSLFVPAGLCHWVALRGMQNAFALVAEELALGAARKRRSRVLDDRQLFVQFGQAQFAKPPRNQDCSSVGLVMRKAVARPSRNRNRSTQSRSICRRSDFLELGACRREDRAKPAGRALRQRDERQSCASGSISITRSSPTMMCFSRPRASRGLRRCGFYRQQAGDPRFYPAASGRRTVMAKVARSGLRQRPCSGGNVRRRRCFSPPLPRRTTCRW